MEHDELISIIERQRNMMIAVATGGPRIDDVNDQYRDDVSESERGFGSVV